MNIRSSLFGSINTTKLKTITHSYIAKTLSLLSLRDQSK